MKCDKIRLQAVDDLNRPQIDQGGGSKVNGAWYGLATVAIALVIRWLILNDPGPSRRKVELSAKEATPAADVTTKPEGSKKSKRWRAAGN